MPPSEISVSAERVGVGDDPVLFASVSSGSAVVGLVAVGNAVVDGGSAMVSDTETGSDEQLAITTRETKKSFVGKGIMICDQEYMTFLAKRERPDDTGQ